MTSDAIFLSLRRKAPQGVMNQPANSLVIAIAMISSHVGNILNTYKFKPLQRAVPPPPPLYNELRLCQHLSERNDVCLTYPEWRHDPASAHLSHMYLLQKSVMPAVLYSCSRLISLRSSHSTVLPPERGEEGELEKKKGTD